METLFFSEVCGRIWDFGFLFVHEKNTIFRRLQAYDVYWIFQDICCLQWGGLITMDQIPITSYLKWISTPM
jgi:hypothetical protein